MQSGESTTDIYKETSRSSHSRKDMSAPYTNRAMLGEPGGKRKRSNDVTGLPARRAVREAVPFRRSRGGTYPQHMTGAFHFPTGLATRAGNLCNPVECLICECGANLESAALTIRCRGTEGGSDPVGDVFLRVGPPHKIQNNIIGVYKTVDVNRKCQGVGTIKQGIRFSFPTMPQ